MNVAKTFARKSFKNLQAVNRQRTAYAYWRPSIALKMVKWNCHIDKKVQIELIKNFVFKNDNESF